MSLLSRRRNLLSPLLVNPFEITINTSLGVGSSFDLPLPSAQIYDFIVDWGDGNKDYITLYNQAEKTHIYSIDGVYTIKIYGKCGGWVFANAGDRLKLTSIDSWGDVGFDRLDSAFYGCTNLTVTPDGLNFTSSVTSLVNFYRECTSLASIGNIIADMSTVTNLSYFMQGCTSLISADVSNWNTQNVTDMSYFAYLCGNLTGLDVSSWNTQNVTTLFYFVRECSSLATLDVSSWNTSNVNDISSFARQCSSIVTLNTNNWDTSSMTTCSGAFRDCTNLTSSFDANLWWNRIPVFSVFVNCFTNSTNISNYASIPNNWKGL